jgi:hypothetical protein
MSAHRERETAVALMAMVAWCAVLMEKKGKRRQRVQRAHGRRLGE